MTELVAFMYGLATMACLIAGVFFLRYWRDSRDRFHLFFASAVALFAVQWVVLVAVHVDDETRPYVYLLRLLGFVVIITAIVDKNRRSP